MHLTATYKRDLLLSLLLNDLHMVQLMPLPPHHLMLH